MIGVCLAIGLYANQAVVAGGKDGQAPPVDTCVFNDSHFHLTNYVQQGTDIHKYVDCERLDRIG